MIQLLPNRLLIEVPCTNPSELAEDLRDGITSAIQELTSTAEAISPARSEAVYFLAELLRQMNSSGPDLKSCPT